jgi:formate dehydrogenase major subunit
MLKAFWGDKATPENDFCYDYYPKLDNRDRSHIGMYKYMGEGEVKGMICWADNPAVSGPSASGKRKYSSQLEWQVVVDFFENETATFWKEPGVNPSEIATEVFLLPAALHIERDGSIANSGRWIQWRNKAYDPPGDCKSDLWIVDKLFKAVRKAYEADPGPFADPILDLNWDYGDEIDLVKVCKELNGYYTDTGEYVENFTKLADDGSTTCGNWIYSGYYNNESDPPCKRRIKETEGIGNNLEWSFAWPVNRRIIYNRCSADPAGNPWNPDKPLLWYEGGEWKRNDVPDFGADGSPEDTAQKPFIMLPELQARLFSSAMVEGPFPEHYEPWESPFENALSSVQFNPASTVWYPDARGDKEQYPYVATTYRISEHYQTAVMTRNMPWLNELVPGLFVEISPSLAAALGINNGDMVIVESKRGSFEAPACVTERIQPLMVNGKEQEIVGMFWHWGYACMSKGPIANDITPSIGDANTTIPEYKAFLCNIRRAG